MCHANHAQPSRLPTSPSMPSRCAYQNNHTHKPTRRFNMLPRAQLHSVKRASANRLPRPRITRSRPKVTMHTPKKAHNLSYVVIVARPPSGSRASVRCSSGRIGVSVSVFFSSRWSTLLMVGFKMNSRHRRRHLVWHSFCTSARVCQSACVCVLNRNTNACKCDV